MAGRKTLATLLDRESLVMQGSRSELYEAGRSLRATCPRRSHSEWRPAADRPDAVQLVLQAEKGRMPDLLPLRHGRMARSPFTFYRAAALTMAFDLASTLDQRLGRDDLAFRGCEAAEITEVRVTAASTETLNVPLPWASFVVACRDNGLSEAVARDVVMTCVRAYRESMDEFSQMKDS